MKIAAIRRAHFNAAHRLHQPGLSDAENQQLFGPCNNPDFHGHNYELEVKVVGEIDAQTGFLIDLGLLRDIIKEEIEDRFDHKNLNLECPEFQSLNPTAENIAVVIWGLLRKRLESRYELYVRLYETPRNFVEYPAG